MSPLVMLSGIGWGLECAAWCRIVCPATCKATASFGLVLCGKSLYWTQLPHHVASWGLLCCAEMLMHLQDILDAMCLNTTCYAPCNPARDTLVLSCPAGKTRKLCRSEHYLLRSMQPCKRHSSAQTASRNSTY